MVTQKQLSNHSKCETWKQCFIQAVLWSSFIKNFSRPNCFLTVQRYLYARHSPEYDQVFQFEWCRGNIIWSTFLMTSLIGLVVGPSNVYFNVCCYIGVPSFWDVFFFFFCVICVWNSIQITEAIGGLMKHETSARCRATVNVKLSRWGWVGGGWWWCGGLGWGGGWGGGCLDGNCGILHSLLFSQH